MRIEDQVQSLSHSANNDLVTVVMPLYNCERFVSDAIESVQAQTYENWQLIIVDDCSLDHSKSVVETYLNDPRIEFIRQEKNSGAAKSRNRAIQMAQGRWIAFLDADDVWYPEKLERQLAFMEENGIGICFTGYETIEESGAVRNIVHVPSTVTYKMFLKNTITCCHTMVVDTQIVDKELILAPIVETGFDYPEDLATWLRMLKTTGQCAHGLDDALAKYRKHENSRSSNKLNAVRRTWNQYRRIEQLNPFYASYCLFWQLFHAVGKRL